MANFNFTAWDDGLANSLHSKYGSLIMMVGLPGSGKSTFAHSIPVVASQKYGYDRDRFIILSSDEIRNELFGCYRQEDTPTVFNELHRRIFENVNKGKYVIYDATNISREKRKNFFNELNNRCKVASSIGKAIVFMATPFESCLKRNKMRDNVVPDEYIEMMYKNMNIPDFFEGANDVCCHYGNTTEVNPFVSLFSENSEFMKFNQDNPNHSLTLGNHCIKCGDALKNKNWFVREAGYLHDIGKMYTKTFKNMKGEVSDVAHYYRHENVSAYESLFYETMECSSNPIYAIYLRAILIRYHMLPYFMEKDRIRNKYNFDNFIMKSIYDIHAADVSAH